MSVAGGSDSGLDLLGGLITGLLDVAHADGQGVQIGLGGLRGDRGFQSLAQLVLGDLGLVGQSGQSLDGNSSAVDGDGAILLAGGDQARADQGLSAWTVQLEAKAMGKLYGISPDDENYFKPPKRNREDIKRSRGDRVRDRHFSKTNNDELIKFCKGTGLRRSELAELRGKDLVTRAQIEAEISSLESRPTAELTPADVKRLGMLQDARLFQGEYFTHVRNGKGGRERLSPIIGPNAAQIVQRIQETPGEEKVWQHVHQSADIHGYRAEYATAIYKAHARAIQDIPYDRINRGTGRRYQSQVYTCRKDEAGRKLDKAAMLVCSKALGHNRISVVADNYIRGL